MEKKKITLGQWLEETEKKIKKGDLIIMTTTTHTFTSGIKYNAQIEKDTLDKYPKLKEVIVIKARVYKAPISDFNINGSNNGKARTCLQHTAVIDYKDYENAIKK